MVSFVNCHNVFSVLVIHRIWYQMEQDLVVLLSETEFCCKEFPRLLIVSCHYFFYPAESLFLGEFCTGYQTSLQSLPLSAPFLLVIKSPVISWSIGVHLQSVLSDCLQIFLRTSWSFLSQSILNQKAAWLQPRGGLFSAGGAEGDLCIWCVQQCLSQGTELHGCILTACSALVLWIPSNLAL